MNNTETIEALIRLKNKLKTPQLSKDTGIKQSTLNSYLQGVNNTSKRRNWILTKHLFYLLTKTLEKLN